MKPTDDDHSKATSHPPLHLDAPSTDPTQVLQAPIGVEEVLIDPTVERVLHVAEAATEAPDIFDNIRSGIGSTLTDSSVNPAPKATPTPAGAARENGSTSGSGSGSGPISSGPAAGLSPPFGLSGAAPPAGTAAELSTFPPGSSGMSTAGLSAPAPGTPAGPPVRTGSAAWQGGTPWQGGTSPGLNIPPWQGPSDPGDLTPTVGIPIAIGTAPVAGAEEFDNEKTAELSALLVPPPISLGPQPITLGPRPPVGESALDAATHALSVALAALPFEVPPSRALYDDDPLPHAAALDEKTADILVHRLDLRGTAESGSDDGSKLPTDEGATVEGAPVDDNAHRTDVGPQPPAGGEVMTADDGSLVKLEDSLGEQGGMVFYRARISVDGVDLGQPFTAVWMPQAAPEPPWAHLPDARLVRPRCRISLERAAIRVFERPKGNTVVDYLADDERLLPAMATIELGLELAELLESLHGAGCCLYDLDPSQIVIEKGGRVRLYAVSGLYLDGQLPIGALGIFCAPEVRRRMSYRTGTASDVYAAALLIYALLAKRAPLDVHTDPTFLATPRVFRPECPLGIWPYLKPCLDPNPARRIGHARGLRQQLALARGRLIAEARATEEQVPVMLEGWAEQHAGLAKARRGSGQQDRALSVTDESGRTGLYLISDGVSRSRYGDGAFAAEQVEWAALQRWTGLEKAGPQALELEHPQRADILKQISRSAGKKIAAEINAKYAPIPNEPNQVMSATLVAAFVVNGDATLGNLGDSRAYLVRDNVIEQVCVDHDRCTDALRLGLSFREAAHVQMGTALTRVVGRVVIDEDGTCRPDPFEPELFRLRLLPGDRLVLCSDGVADFAAGAGAPQAEQDAKIKETVLTWEDPGRAAFELVVLANRAGGYDNISCVVIAVHPA